MSSAVISTTLSKAIASADGFHHLVYSISGTTHTLFLDNSAIAINISGGNVFTNYQTISNLFFGIAGDMSYGYTGYLDDVKVFNRALGLTDVSNIYNNSVKKVAVLGLGPLDKLSTDAKISMIYSGTGTPLSAGAYGITLLYSIYTGPSIQIKNGSSGTPTDFYPALDGTPTLTTAYGGAGTSLTIFLSGAIAYVTKWYDQTGNTNHATAVNTPIYDTLNNRISFATGYFRVLNATNPTTVNPFPTGNSVYSYLFTPSNFNLTTPTTTQVIYSGGTNGNNNYCAGILISDVTYFNFWYNNGKFTSTTSPMVSGTKVADCYSGGSSANRIFYLNNNVVTSNTIQNTGGRTQGFGNCYLGFLSAPGYTNLESAKYNGTLHYFYWAPYQLNTSDITILGNT